MPSVCFYFQVHQPYRLKSYSYFAGGKDHQYFDDKRNGEILRKVASKCYIPMNQTLLEMIERYEGKFKCSFSITATAIDQMIEYSPESLELFKKLVATGCAELLSETSHHSLSVLYDRQEFEAQVKLHRKRMQEIFGVTPQVFRNTELIYEDWIGQIVADLGFKGMIAEGADDVLAWRSPNFHYHVTERSETRLLLKNYRLSDDIAFRFSNRGWGEWPLTAEKFASWVHQVSGAGDVVNLFMDYETFGEHQWSDTGIFDFMRHLPEKVMAHPDWGFKTPSECIAAYPARAPMEFRRLTSWADLERDITAWRGNRMQVKSLDQVYSLGQAVAQHRDDAVREMWRKLLTSDHYYYMCTKWFSDGDVHAYFSPYGSPYEAFINFQNVLRDFRSSMLGMSEL